MIVKGTGESLHKTWAEFLVAHGKQVMPWAELPEVTKGAWNSLVAPTKAKPVADAVIVTERSILPERFIQAHMREDSWKAQYMSFEQATRDAAAKRLYEALTEKQRVQLKEEGHIAFKCAKGHNVIATPEYAGTTNVGCFSIAGTRGSSMSTHRPTTIGDFLLALKIQFAATCVCRRNYM